MNQKTTAAAPAESPKPSAPQSTTSAVPESAEVKLAREDEERRARRDDLMAASIIFGVDIGNAGDAIQHALEQGREGDAKRALDRLHERYKTGHALLSKHFKELPVLNP